MKHSEVTLGRFLRILLLLMMLAGSYFVLDSLSGVLLPFAIAWLLAYLIQPLVAFVQHRMRFKFRMLSIVVSLLFIGAVVYGILMLVIPSMLAELLTLKNITLSFLNENLANSSIPEPVVVFFKSVAEENGLAAMLNSNVDVELYDFMLDKLQMLFFGTADLLQAMFTTGVILLYIFFILLDFERLSDEWTLYIPKRWRGVTVKLWDDLV